MLKLKNKDEFVVFLPNLVSLKTLYLKFEDKYIKFSSNMLDYIDEVYDNKFIYENTESEIIASITMLVDKDIFPYRYDFDKYNDSTFTKKEHPMYVEGVFNEVVNSDNLIIYKYHYPNESLHIHNRFDNSFFSVVSNRKDAIKYSKFAIKQVLSAYLLKKQIYPIHASAVYKQQKGYIFVASSHQGKSSLFLNLIANGFEPLNDDIVFWGVCDNNVILYPCPILSQKRATTPQELKMSDKYIFKEIENRIDNYNDKQSKIVLDSIFWLSKGHKETVIKSVEIDNFFKKLLRSCSVHNTIPMNEEYLFSLKKLVNTPNYEFMMSNDYNDICYEFNKFIENKKN